MRGRVMRIDGGIAIIRTDRADITVAAEPNWRPGDLVVDDRIERDFGGGDFPTPQHEAARMPRARLENLRKRAAAMAALRAFFAARDFLEVETPLLVRAPGLEVNLEAIPAGRGPAPEWLITSPEFQMKRLLAAGCERIVQVCKCFRDEEAGAHHAREFTMIEWYRGWDDLESIIADTEQLAAAVAMAVNGTTVITRGVQSIDLAPPWQRITVRDAMHRWANVLVDGDEPADVLRARVVAAGIDVGNATAWDDVFYAAFVARADPAIAGLPYPLLLTEWPAPLAALARRKADDPRVAERFEAYAFGLELANAFGELTDPHEQRRRFADDIAARAARGRRPVPMDERLLDALVEGLPPSAGIALGFDRLVMLVTGATQIRDVLSFADDER